MVESEAPLGAWRERRRLLDLEIDQLQRTLDGLRVAIIAGSSTGSLLAAALLHLYPYPADDPDLRDAIEKDDEQMRATLTLTGPRKGKKG